jgi:hypothetical protein
MTDTMQTLALLTSAYAQTFPDKLIQLFNRMAVTLALFPVQTGAGKNISWDVEYDGALAENHAEGADAANFGSDGAAPALLSWGHYRSNFHVSDTAEMVGASSHSPSDLRSPWARNWLNSVRKLASTINGKAYTGDGTGTEMSGLSVALKDDNTYAGIDRTAGTALATGFKAKVIDPGTLTAITRDLVGKDLSDIKVLSGERPDIALVHPDVFQKVRGLFEPGRRWEKEVYSARGKTILDNSADVIIIDNCQFVEDKDATNNAIHYLNSNYVYWEALPRPAGTGWDGPLVPSDQADAGRLLSAFHAYEIARLGESRRGSVAGKLNLVVSKPLACGIRKNVSTT